MVEVDDGPSEAGRWSKKKPLGTQTWQHETSARLTIDEDFPFAMWICPFLMRIFHCDDDFPINFPICNVDLSIFDEDFPL